MRGGVRTALTAILPRGLVWSFRLGWHGFAKVYSIAAGLSGKVIRNGSVGLLRTDASFFKAPSLATSGIDTKIGDDFSIGGAGTSELASG